MKKEEIMNALENEHLKLFEWLEKQPDQNWIKGPKEKWTTGQHILHLVDAIKKLNKAMNLPKFLLKSKFGVSNRELRSYNAVVKRYQEKLTQNQEKAKIYNTGMKIPTVKEKKQLLYLLAVQNKKLQNKTNKWKDAHLDTLILPHPLLGKMPIREIIMWTAYHTAHHTRTLIENY
jgi:hypothetical protein